MNGKTEGIEGMDTGGWVCLWTTLLNEGDLGENLSGYQDKCDWVMRITGVASGCIKSTTMSTAYNGRVELLITIERET
jgi:hypothetical protein